MKTPINCSYCNADAFEITYQRPCYIYVVPETKRQQAALATQYRMIKLKHPNKRTKFPKRLRIQVGSHTDTFVACPVCTKRLKAENKDRNTPRSWISYMDSNKDFFGSFWAGKPPARVAEEIFGKFNGQPRRKGRH